MSNRRAQDERIEGTPDGVNAISEIVDIPDAPTIGTATAGLVSASVAFTPATTGGTVSLFTATSNPDSITGTSATSPITVSGLTGGTAYTFTVRGTNSTGTSPESSSSNSVTPEDLPGSYDALATVTVSSGSTASIEFTGIPTVYKHLQIRSISRSTAAQNYFGMRMQVGDGSVDTGANYSVHELYGNGSTVVSSANAPQSTTFIITSLAANDLANTFGVGIIDILDYGNTNKFKTFCSLSGGDVNTAGLIFFNSSSWRSSSAINTIKFYPSAGNFSQYTQISIYGVK